MKFRAQFALGILLFLTAASAGFAEGDEGAAKPASAASSDGTSPTPASPPAAPPTANSDSTALPAANSNAAAAPAASPQNTEQTQQEEGPKWDPMPASSGNPGLLTLETGETLSKGSFDIVAGVNKISRMPGSTTILQVQPAFAVGVTDWLSFSFEMDAWNHIHVDTPADLSLSPVNINNPQFRNTIYPSVLPVSGSVVNPAYVEDFPFAASNHGDYGQIDLGVKIALVSMRRGHSLNLSLSNDFIIPTTTGLSSLYSNQTQNGGFSYRVGLEASKPLLHHSMIAVVNATYQIFPGRTYNSGGTPVTLQQADQLRVGGGFLMFPDKRINVISEYDALIYVGTATPNTTFGARDPVDSVYGVRFYLAKHLAFDAGYRYNMNLSSDKDRNGFVAKVAFASWRERPAPPPPTDRLYTTCAVDKATVSAGSSDLVEASVNASDTAGHPLTFIWTATGGNISGSGPFARWDHSGAAPGSYTLSVRVDDGAGHSSSCAAQVTVTP